MHPFPDPSPVLLRGAYVAPMDGPIIPDGILAIREGRILDVGNADRIAAKYAGSRFEDLGQIVLLPGLINAHVHLELTGLIRPNPPVSFVDWLLNVISQAPQPIGAGIEQIANATRSGIAQCLRFGVTTVGDITRHPGITRQVLSDSPLRAVSFGEVTAMAGRRHLLEERVAAAVTVSPAPDRIISAISPHAPYSIEAAGYERCIAAAKAAGVPIATHLAETQEEQEFLTQHSGPFRRLWSTIGGWDEQVPKYNVWATTPITFARDVGMLDAPHALLAHVNYADGLNDIELLAACKATVVYCPRTHAYFGHPPHPWIELLAEGVRVVVGTDSTASSPDLNLVDDLRLLHRLSPETPTENLWRMATIGAAKAMGLQKVIGSLTAEKSADLTAFPVISADPLREILENNVLPSRVWINGNSQ